MNKLKIKKEAVRNIFMAAVFVCLLSGCQQKQETSSVNPELLKRMQEAKMNAQMQTDQTTPQFGAQGESKGQGEPQEVKVEQEESQKVVISIDKYGRDNPFKPYYEKNLFAGGIGNTEIYNLPDVPGPPSGMDVDQSVKALMSVTVAGILYDKVKPSAIVNINENDYLVHKGDIIFDFYIQDIEPDLIAVQSGSNLYKAGVGEIIESEISTNTVYNLDNMFAGNRKSSYVPELEDFEIDEYFGNEIPQQ